MKKILTLICVVCIILIIGYSTDGSKIATATVSPRKDRLQMIKEKGVLTIVFTDDPPFAYIDPKTNKLSGIDADIITEIAKRLGINKIEFKKAPFYELLDKLNTDENIDLASDAIYITPEREKIVSFTQPLYKESEVIIVTKTSKINFKEDLKNAVVGAEKGTKFADLIQDWKKNNLVKDVVIFNNNLETLNAINSGKIDAGVADFAITKYALENSKLFLKILPGYTPVVYGTIGIAVKKSDITLLNALNEKINEMKTDGTLYAILVKNGLDKNNMIE
ncbi:ABC transporter substrate-binding protein [Clostridium sp. SHJSY1]|uniref:ABC transporter substrate-binding protein n=1 Tax=Clostridium sp. SHJSY1 TaxID=2942483 RepID=UPI002874D585|nr:ABC transporter substrate-binding protein [Clostridium sp. SHJSY1]MDS0527890.1 ABC transporter substrate-binding protein [Clostridium sp. SHJSY1]